MRRIEACGWCLGGLPLFAWVMTQLVKKLSPQLLGHLPAFLLPLLSSLLYLPALNHGFILDDRWLVTENPYIKSWGYLPQMLSEDAWNIWDRHNYWRPAFTLSLALDYSLWGLDAAGFHLHNVLLHAANTGLLYSLGNRLLSQRAAGVAALLFALHPIQAQPVSVISMRGDLLAACFALLALHAFFARKTVFFAIALLFALLSKETSMVLPAALLFAWILLPRDHQGTGIVLAFVILGIYLAIRLSLGFSFSLPPSIFSYDAPWEIRWLLAFKVLALYFLALLNPFEIPHPLWSVELPASLSDPYVLGGMAVSALLILTTWAASKKRPAAAFVFIWFAVYFLPISNLKQLNQPMAALVAREKTKIYKDDETFVLAAVRANPRIAKLHSMLGSIYLTRQDIPRAKEFYGKALSIDPNDFLANYRTGFLLYRAGQREEAKVYLEKVVRSEPRPLYEILIVADAWEMLGDKQRALFYYRKAFGLNPWSAYIRERVAALENR